MGYGLWCLLFNLCEFELFTSFHFTKMNMYSAYDSMTAYFWTWEPLTISIDIERPYHTNKDFFQKYTKLFIVFNKHQQVVQYIFSNISKRPSTQVSLLNGRDINDLAIYIHQMFKVYWIEATSHCKCKAHSTRGVHSK